MGARSASSCYARHMGRRVDPEQTERARALRKGATEQERTLWKLLSRYRPKFTRQLPIGAFIADFAGREARLIVEVDGSQHVQCEADAHRTTCLNEQGER